MRRFNEPSSWRRWKTRSAPSQPSLSCTATTRGTARGGSPCARRRPSRPPSGGRRCRGSARRIPRGGPGRLAVRVPLDHAAGHLEVGVGQRERRGVDPERVVVLGHQRHRHVAGDSVECLRRLDRRRPLAVPPAEPAQPAALRHLADRRCHTRERVVERLGALEPHLPLRQRPAREVHVGVGEAREDAQPAEVDALGLASAVSCVPTPPAIRSPAIASAAARGSEGSSVRTTPFSRITLETIVRGTPTPRRTAGVHRGVGPEPGCCDSQPVRRRFGYSENMSGFCSTIAPASVSPVMTMCL